MDEPLKIAVCEDSPADRDKLASILEQSTIPVSCQFFQSGEEFLSAYHPHKFDLLLLDIYMTGITGVDVVSKIREIDEDVSIAFVTSSIEHTLEAYRLSVLKYIEKPYKAKAVEETLRFALMKRNSLPQLTVWCSRKETPIPFSKIVYLEQKSRHINIHLTDDDCLVCNDKLSSLLPQLEEQGFYSPHISFCVNLNFVQQIDSEMRCFVMHNGDNVPIRRGYIVKSRKALEDFLFKKARENA